MPFSIALLMDMLSLLSPNTVVFENTLYQYFMFFLVILGFVFISKIVYYIIKNYVRKVTEKTKTDFDDLLVDIVEHPVVLFVIILGVFIGNVFFITENTYVYGLINTVVKILLIIDVAWLVIRVFDTLIVRYMQQYAEKSETKLDDQLLPILRKGTKIIVILITLLFILSNFGYDVTALLAGLGVGGIAVALAAQDTIGNFIASILIFTGKPFKIGDTIKFGSFIGTVYEVGLRTTKLETPMGTKLIVPNSKISSDIVENLTDIKSRRVDLTIGLTYDTPYPKLVKAMKLIEKIVSSHPNVVKWDIKFIEFGAYSLNISVFYWIKDITKYRDTIGEINLEIKRVLDKEKIEMAFPTQTLYLKK